MSAAAPLFAEDDAPRVATDGMKAEALERELRYRRQVYPRRVAEKRMTQAQADYQCWILEEIIRTGFTPPATGGGA